jgi:putative oxidoreductase
MDIETILLVMGRVLLASIFVAAGIKHCIVAREIIPMIAARGIPYPRLVLGVGSAFEFIFGLMLMFGIAGPWAPLGLAVFTIAATLMLVNFWDMQGPARDQALTGFQYNVAILGGLLVAASVSI